MGFNSKYSGSQVEKSIETALGICAGTVTLTAASDGHANVELENVAPGNGKMCSFASVKRSDYGTSGQITPIISHDVTPTGDVVRIHLFGNGVHKGAAYTVDYMLVINTVK